MEKYSDTNRLPERLEALASSEAPLVVGSGIMSFIIVTK
jgi:hypothetical protein